MDNTPTFWLMFVQCLGFFFFTLAPTPVMKLGVDKKLAGDTARTNDQNKSKGYSTLYNIMLRNKTQVAEREDLSSHVAVAQRLAGHRSACERW